MKKFLSILLALCLLLAVPLTAAAAGPAASNNVGLQDYGGNAFHPINSYLYANEKGGLTRVEYIDGEILVEDYSSAFALLSTKTLAAPLPEWGGFFAGEEYNFIITGQDNLRESDSVEVIRVSKYSKDWQHLDDCQIYGSNTRDLAKSGTVRCTEGNGALYIRTEHTMYVSSDGLNHQANVTLQIRESDMSYIDGFYGVANSDRGYVSHSFNQFIFVDSEDNLVALDHGDAYPRGIALFKYPTKAGMEPIDGGRWNVPWKNIIPFTDETGEHYNYTGCMAGGFAEARNDYVTSYSYKEGKNPGIFLAFSDKDDMNTKIVKVAGLEEYTSPVLAPTSLDGGYVLWRAKYDGYGYGMVNYAKYDANGKEEAADSGSFSDMPTDPDFVKAINWAVENGVTKGDGGGKFSPKKVCSRGQIVTFIYRAQE